MSRPREWRQASRAKAGVVEEFDRPLCGVCFAPTRCFEVGRYCEEYDEHESVYENWETTDAISGNRLCPLTGQSCFRSLCYNADRCEEETTDAPE